MPSQFRLIELGDQAKIENLFKVKGSQLNWIYTDFIDHPDCFGLVVVEDGEIVGFGSLIRYHTPVHGIIGRLEDIFVHPLRQGKGLGKDIISELIKLGKKLGLLQIVLTSNPSRIAARHIYQSLGFVTYETGVFVKDL